MLMIARIKIIRWLCVTKRDISKLCTYQKRFPFEYIRCGEVRCVCVQFFLSSDGLNINRKEHQWKIIMIRLKDIVYEQLYFVKCTSEDLTGKKESERRRRRQTMLLFTFATMTGWYRLRHSSFIEPHSKKKKQKHYMLWIFFNPLESVPKNWWILVLFSINYPKLIWFRHDTMASVKTIHPLSEVWAENWNVQKAIHLIFIGFKNKNIYQMKKKWFRFSWRISIPKKEIDILPMWISLQSLAYQR